MRQLLEQFEYRVGKYGERIAPTYTSYGKFVSVPSVAPQETEQKIIQSLLSDSRAFQYDKVNNVVVMDMTISDEEIRVLIKKVLSVLDASINIKTERTIYVSNPNNESTVKEKLLGNDLIENIEPQTYCPVAN